jgi:hypothetical protein
MNIIIAVEIDAETVSIRNMEVFANPSAAATAIRRMGWADHVAELFESGSFQEGNGIRVLSPDKTTWFEAGILAVSGTMVS